MMRDRTKKYIALRASGWNLFPSRGLSFKFVDFDRVRGSAHAKASVDGWKWELTLDDVHATVVHEIVKELHWLVFTADDATCFRAQVLKCASGVINGFSIEGEKSFRLTQPRRWYSALFRGSQFQLTQGKNVVAEVHTSVAVRRVGCSFDQTVPTPIAAFATILVAMHWNALAFQGE